MIKIIIILALIVGIITGVYLITSGSLNLFSRADQSANFDYPQNVLVSNITDTSFTLTYFTPDKPRRTAVKYGTDSSNLDKTAYDDRGREAGITRYTHYVILTDLKPNTEYFIKIEEGIEGYPKETFLKQKTAPSPSGDSNEDDRFYGIVYNDFGRPPTESIIYFKTDLGELLSNYSDGAGNWEFKLNEYKKRDLSSYFQIQKVDQVEVLALSGVDGLSYLKTTGFAKNRLLKLPLELKRVPFFGIRLGPLPGEGSAGEPSTSAQANSPAPKSFFDIVWEYFKGFFAL